MTTTVFSPGDATDGQINSNSTVYSTARSTASSVDDAPALETCGQRFLTPNYVCWETFHNFDTSSIPDGDVVQSVVLSLWGGGNNSDTDFTLEARLHTWGSPLVIGDWVAGDSLASKTLLATFDTTAWTNGAYNAFTSEVAFAANINKIGKTYIFLSSSRHRIGNTPTGNEYIQITPAETAGTANDPKLVVTHVGGFIPVEPPWPYGSGGAKSDRLSPTRRTRQTQPIQGG